MSHLLPMSHLLRRRVAAPEPTLVTEHQLLLGSAAARGVVGEIKPPQHHSHQLGKAIAAAWRHVPHSLPEPHKRYPPRYPEYLESARMSREMFHL